ncbi:hypothetical protein [Helicobacter fennelliae]|uniref:hypothetical protein n=1 Tax=Helicobacter fennelliae TaxID=215 RepID=UPI000DFE1B15|nr:hypothetical protein [Helicobacter fennelliae]STQ83777.1 Uncharacterised protein [Helicobacter fennelliae]
MGFGNTHLQKLRKVGRKVVLPTDEIQAILESKIDFSSLTTIVDFGAGTLFWSEYFASKLDNNAMGGGQSNNNHPQSPHQPT